MTRRVVSASSASYACDGPRMCLDEEDRTTPPRDANASASTGHHPTLGAEGDAGVDVELGHGHAGGVDAVDAPRTAGGGRAAGEPAEHDEVFETLDWDAVAADEALRWAARRKAPRRRRRRGGGKEARGG